MDWRGNRIKVQRSAWSCYSNWTGRQWQLKMWWQVKRRRVRSYFRGGIRRTSWWIRHEWGRGLGSWLQKPSAYLPHLLEWRRKGKVHGIKLRMMFWLWIWNVSETTNSSSNVWINLGVEVWVTNTNLKLIQITSGDCLMRRAQDWLLENAKT